MFRCSYTWFSCPYTFGHVALIEWNKYLLIKNVWSLKSDLHFNIYQKQNDWRKERKKKIKRSVNVSVALLSPIPPGHLLGGLRQTLWLLCVCLRYGLGCSLSDRPLHTFLCSPPASLGRWTNWFGHWLFKGAYFITFALASLHLPLLLFSLHLPLSNSHPYPAAAALLDTAEGGPWAV